MPRRTPETLADYLVVAICPALIMLLVGSLMFFLVEVFYQGQFELRLYWVLAMFVMGIVCLTRLAMEEGFGYASLYAAPLGLLVGLALVKFVQFGGPLGPYSLLVNWALMAWVWWCAHKLTWDSTLIEDTEDASGQGLLQHLRLEADPRSDQQQSQSRSETPDEAMSSLHPAARSTLAWWKSWLEADRRPHPAGIWVVYFSLGALPLVGIGGRFVPPDDLDARRRCFWLLVVYVASAMCLLLATSFLGLRKYLRQRRLEMPLDMAAVWVGAGVVLIVATLVVASLIPRPSPEYSLAHLVDIDSLDRRASQYAFGPEKGEGQGAAGRETGDGGQEAGNGGQQKEDRGQTAEDGGQRAGDSQQGAGKSGQQGGGKSESGGKQGEQSAGDKASDAGKSSSRQTGDGKSAEKSAGKNGKSANESGDSKPRSAGQQQADQPDDASKSSRPQNESGESAESRDEASDESRDAAGAQQSPPARQPSGSGAVQRLLSGTQRWFGSLGGLIKAILYLVLAIAAAFIAWRYRRQLLEAWNKLLAELRSLWESWFGKPATKEETPSQTVAAPRPFAQFTDPFVGGASARMSPAELVRYTFRALEAWGRENGCPRAEGQTPHEFAAAIGQLDHTLASEAAHLADLYARLAYAQPAPIRTTFEPLRSLWRKMTTPAVIVM